MTQTQPTINELSTFEACLLRGINCLRNKRYSEAIVQLSNAIQQKNNNCNAYSYRAYVYYLTKRYDDALVDLTKALSFSPDNFLAYQILEKVNEKITGMHYLCDELDTINEPE